MKAIPTASLIILAGCSPSPRSVTATHSGDLGQFILQSVASHGGRAQTTNGLPELQTQWRADVLTGAEYLNGREQVSIVITGDRFQEVTSYLAHAFGVPSQPAAHQTDGIIHGWYSIGDIGVALQFYRDQKETGLILVGEVQSGKRVTLEGTAETRKLGAVVRGSDFVVWVDRLEGWPPELEGHRVQVSGIPEERHDLPVFIAKPGDKPRAGMPVPEGTDLHLASLRQILRDAKWKRIQ